MAEYKIAAITHCQFHLGYVNFDPTKSDDLGAHYTSGIKLELMAFTGTGFSGAAPKITLHFLNHALHSAVTQETTENVSVDLPVAYFAGFYPMLQQSLTNGHGVILTTYVKGKMTVALFDFPNGLESNQ